MAAALQIVIRRFIFQFKHNALPSGKRGRRVLRVAGQVFDEIEVHGGGVTQSPFLRLRLG